MARLEVISTDDPIPNKGYTLSNKKIKSTGFKFLYKIENSVEEMIHAWIDKNTITVNEEIEIGADNYKDERGIISNYYFDLRTFGIIIIF